MAASTATRSRAVLISGCAALILVPLVVLPDGYQFANLPKLLILQACAAVIAAFAVVFPQQRAPGLPLLALLALSLLQLFRSLNPHEATIPVFVLSGAVTVGFGLVLLTDEASRPAIVRAAVWTAGIVGLVGVLEYWGVSFAQVRSAGRPSSTIGFRNTAATYAAGCLPLAAWLVGRRGLDRFTGAASTIFLLLFVAYTRSRGAWLGLGVSAVAGAVWWWRSGMSFSLFSQRWLPAAIVGLAAVGYLATMPPGFTDASPSRLDERKQSVEETVRSLTTPGGDRDRLAVWGHSARMFADHAIAGAGAGNWSALYPAYDRGDVLHIQSAPRRPHNDYLWVGVELGLLGLAAMLWVILGALRSGLTSADGLRAAAACSALAICVHAGFSFPREQAAPSMILWLSVALAGGGRTFSRGLSQSAWVCLLVAGVAGAHFGTRALRSDRAFERALAAQVAERPQAQQEHALESLRHGPYDHRIYLALGDAQDRLGDREGAAKTYRQYTQVQPNLPAAWNNLGRLRNAIGDHAGAETALLRAREVLPDDAYVRNNLAEALRRQGRVGEAIALYGDARGLSAAEHENLGLLFGMVDSLERAAHHYREALRLEPDRAEVVYSLAGIDLLAGRLDAAIDGYERYLAFPEPNPTLVRRSEGRLREVYGARAAERLRAGDAVGAIDALEKRRSLGDMTASEVHNLALAYGRTKRFAAAARAAREAIEIDPTLTIARLTLGNALYELGDPGAVRHLEAFVEAWDGDPRLTRAATARLRRLRN